MMKLATDILDKLEKDFGRDVPFAKDELEALYIQTNWMISDQMVRAIVYLAKGDLECLKQTIERSAKDHRDVLWEAEYDRGDDQLRDFKNEFKDIN